MSSNNALGNWAERFWILPEPQPHSTVVLRPVGGTMVWEFYSELGLCRLVMLSDGVVVGPTYPDLLRRQGLETCGQVEEGHKAQGG